jgi:hypothetical protein
MSFFGQDRTELTGCFLGCSCAFCLRGMVQCAAGVQSIFTNFHQQFYCQV